MNSHWFLIGKTSFESQAPPGFDLTPSWNRANARFFWETISEDSDPRAENFHRGLQILWLPSQLSCLLMGKKMRQLLERSRTCYWVAKHHIRLLRMVLCWEALALHSSILFCLSGQVFKALSAFRPVLYIKYIIFCLEMHELSCNENWNSGRKWLYLITLCFVLTQAAWLV